MQWHKRKCVINIIFQGIATSVCSHIAAWMAVASVKFAWQFTGHVIADAALRIGAIFSSH